MSQHPQQIDGSYDAQLDVLPQDSPTIGRKAQQYSPNNALPVVADSQYRSQRKAAPSPLQTSTTAAAAAAAASPPASVTPTRSTFHRTGVDHTIQTYTPKGIVHGPEDIRPPPKERPDGQPTPEKSFYKSEDSSTESIPNTINPRSGRPLHDTNATSRSVSEPVLTSKPVGGLSAKILSMAAPGAALQGDMGRGAPRQSSIDSAISSMSDIGPGRSSQDRRPGDGSPDITNLIHAAGSPEAVIQYLLKEKQSQAAQNSQLWRLVDKQRAMILGLNKDLERALKDKERYRKKLKENLAMFSNSSPSESNQGRAGSIAGSDAGSISSIPSKRAETPKAGNVEALVSAGLRDSDQDHPPSPIDVALAPYPITPPASLPATASPGLNNLVEAEHKMPSPAAHAFQQYDADAPAPGSEAGQQQRKVEEIAREVPYNASLPPSRSLPSNPPPKGPPPSIPAPKAPMSSSLSAPSVSVIEASPIADRGDAKFSPTPRKGPPAPLNLGKENDPSSHLRMAGDADESDSDYDDMLEINEIPAFPERGRRKTREEDDREREIAAQKDAERRSLSKKSNQNSGKATPKSRPTTPKDTDPMPASPRLAVPIAPPQRSAEDENAGSLAGMLSASAARGSGVVSPPLMSPGLPVSPRPMDRGMSAAFTRTREDSSNTSSLNSPPMSPRGLAAFLGGVPLSPRAPRQPIPLPPGTPISLTSPAELKGEPLQLVSPKPLVIAKRCDDVANSSPKDESPRSIQTPSPADDANGVYKGFVTDEYPDLLLPPNALPSIEVKVASSRLKPSRASVLFPRNVDEDPVFTLAVFSRADGKELWRCEKDSSSLLQLDQILKQSSQFAAKTPERSLFNGHAPAKLDARRVALDKYLDEMLNTPMDTASAIELCRYLSTNTMEANVETFESLNVNGDSVSESPIKTGPGGRPYKNGYLTKRGKNFGGWKARFFVLDGPVFRYFESPGGPHLGTIKLQNAQIGKQQQAPENDSPSRADNDDVDNQYRHAFLILEPKRKDSSSLVRHVLCAESDKERDQWVDALLQWVDFKEEDDDPHPNRPQSRQHERKDSSGSGHVTGIEAKKKKYGPGRIQHDSNDDLRGVSYENTKQGNMPRRLKNNGTPSPPTNGHEQDPMTRAQLPQNPKTISAPKNAQIIQDSTSWGNRSNMLNPMAAEDRIKQKKRSFFGFGSKPRASGDSSDTMGNDSTSSLSQMAFDQHGPIRPAFGAPLSEAVRYNHPVNVSIELPAVVYRCIEYLDSKNAAGEEGIFRLSGSNVVIKQLRERFNTEGDVNLVTDDQYYDIHAVASLLKLYLRELPSTILTRELHLEFLAVTELSDVNEKVSALNGLVHRLPRANNALLRYLSGFLINIINHSDTNKMTVRNVGIVFSPTLNIPAPVFALFLQQYDGIFGDEPESHDQVEVTVTAPPLSPEDIRSPRRQKFQDLPTPSYEQQSFHPATNAPPPFPPPQHYQQRSGYDTGFTPMQPSYEPQLQTLAGPEYGSRAPTLAGPAYDVYNGGGSGPYRQYTPENLAPTTKKRRESSMFGMSMGLGQKKASSQRLREDSRLVDDESFFD